MYSRILKKPVFLHHPTAWLFPIFCLFCLHLAYAYQQPRWSPIDEQAHYDYIDVLTQGRLPAPDADITEYTHYLTTEIFHFAPADNLGLVGKSYQAQQPPVYYALLAIPNWVLKTLAVDPTQQIRLLRFITQLFILLGCLLLIPIFKELQQLFGIQANYGYVFACLLLCLQLDRRYALSNDNLALFLSHFSLLCLLRAWRLQQLSYVGLASTGVTLAFLTKYSNGLLLVPLGVFLCLWGWYVRYTLRAMLSLMLVNIPLLLIPCYLLVNKLLYGDAFKNNVTQNYFASFVQPIGNPQDFIHLFLEKLWNINHFFNTPSVVANISFILFVLTLLVCLLSGWRYLRATMWVAFTCGMSLLTLWVAWWLNNHYVGVYWFEFRHFNAYNLYFLLANFGFIFFLREIWQNNIVQIAGLLFSTLGVWACVQAGYLLIS
ncbi:hypothetical protein BegalDRAFT_1322 [Beggiatoa alba B18LD]|uniref:Uncharacterized protein n=1 Tax=Beggiatoa alba B18LD TaxID=395493 RepID=I3CF25_9GAMM|nr:glycosyltransferase family 39 protein [Beggiatoa alba]EIJ42218.1 hypothetical protein BegalDRAFT_1322 [Beggiatoa alba B18LD]